MTVSIDKKRKSSKLRKALKIEKEEGIPAKKLKGTSIKEGQKRARQASTPVVYEELNEELIEQAAYDKACILAMLRQDIRPTTFSDNGYYGS